MTRTLTNLFVARSPRSRFAGALAFLDALDVGASVALAAHIAERAQIQAYGFTAASRLFLSI